MGRDDITGSCILGKGPRAPGCDGGCASCGWNVKVEERRIAAINRGAMLSDEHGLRRLPLKNGLP